MKNKYKVKSNDLRKHEISTGRIVCMVVGCDCSAIHVFKSKAGITYGYCDKHFSN